MRFTYWTIQAGFGGMRVGSVGVGIIVTAPDLGASRMKIISGLDALPKNLGPRKPVMEWLRRLEKDVNSFGSEPQLGIDHPASVETMVNRLTRQMHNIIQIDKARPASGESLVEVTELLFSQMIVGEDSKPVIQRGRNQILGAVRAAYGSHPAVAERLVEKPELIVGHRHNQLDFAVVENESSGIYEVSHAFSFVASSNPQSLVANVDSWTWGVDTLRNSGGQLRLAGEKVINIDDETPVLAVISPPETDEQRDIFARATAEWSQLGIRAITPAEMVAHVSTLEKLILSA